MINMPEGHEGQTGRHAERGNGTGANVDPAPTPENLYSLYRGTILQFEGLRIEMRDLRRQMRIWDHLPVIQLVVAGGVGGLVAGAICVGTILALLAR